MATGTLTLENIYPADAVNGVRLDPTVGRKILFGGLETAGGIKTWKYTGAILTPADTQARTDLTGKMPGLDIGNSIVMIPNLETAAPGAPGVYSNKYSDAGMLTYAPPEVNPDNGSYDVGLVQGTKNLAIIAALNSARTIEYNPTTGGFVDGYLDTVLVGYQIRAVAYDITPGRDLVFLGLNNGTVNVWKINTVTGGLTYVTGDNRGALSGQGLGLDITRKLMFFCAEDRTDVYKYTDAGLLTHSHAEPAFNLSEDIALDTVNQVAVVGDYGAYSYTYDDNGVMAGPISSFSLSGGGKGIAMDTADHVVFEGSGSNGLRSFSYEVPSTPVVSGAFVEGHFI